MKKKYIVLGAGISGLAAGWFLKTRKPDADVVILEKSGRSGGWIQTQNIDGFLFEQGPRSLRPKGQGLITLRLIQELGLEQEVVLASPDAAIRYVYEDKTLKPLPHHFFSLFSSSFSKTILKALWTDFRHPRENREDESIYAFAARHFGRETAERLIDPMTFGIFAGNCRELSINTCFPLWKKWERSHGSLIKGLFSRSKPSFKSAWEKSIYSQPLISFKNGMETLTRALHNRLEPHIHLNTEVKAISLFSEKVEVELTNGEKMEADHLYSTLPGPLLYELLRLPAPPLSFSSVGVVNMGFHSRVLKKKGFGYLIASSQNAPILGMVWDSSAFPTQNAHPKQTRLTVMLSGQKADNFEEKARLALQSHLDIHQHPDVILTTFVEKAIPQYPVGFTPPFIAHPCVTCLGTSFRGISVNDCIAAAYEL